MKNKKKNKNKTERRDIQDEQSTNLTTLLLNENPPNQQTTDYTEQTQMEKEGTREDGRVW